MKKTFLKFAYVSAIALTGMMGFSACQSDSAEEVNPNYDPESNSVKTEFAFNISSNAKQKMTGANTQQDGTNFLGMNTMWLYCLAADPAAASTFLANGQINLGSLAESEISSAQSSKIYSMFLPVGTKNFLFYGSQGGFNAAGGHTYGQLTKVFPDEKTSKLANVGAITFALKPIVEVANADLVAKGNILVKYLNDILEAKGSNNMTWIGTQWYLDSGHGTAEDRLDFKEIASLYNAFVKQMNYRQLSGFETLRSVQDLYNSIVRVINKSTNDDVKAVANAVKAAIEANFTVAGTGPYTLTYQATDTKITNFPSQQGLPAGAAVVTTEPKAISAVTSNTFASFDTFTLSLDGENTLGQSIASDAYEITYPSELTYFTNSKAVTSTGAHAASDYPKTVENWDNIADQNWAGASTNKTDWRFPGEVTVMTTAAAIRQNIKYGAAQLVSYVKITPNASNKLIDNAKQITITNDATYDLLEDKEDQEIAYSAGMFTWKGILIGGQPTESNWQFLPSGERSRVIYDNAINAAAVNNAPSATPTYTLVMDNYNGGTNEDKVRIALELENNTGQDFYGQDGLIPAGGTFYLVGELDPTSPTSGTPINWGEVYNHATKPDVIDHPGLGTQRVFIQDFKTTVNFNISEKALQKAYSSIPDLRSTKLLFGLSVDLTWKTGLSFDIDLGPTPAP